MSNISNCFAQIMSFPGFTLTEVEGECSIMSLYEIKQYDSAYIETSNFNFHPLYGLIKNDISHRYLTEGKLVKEEFYDYNDYTYSKRFSHLKNKNAHSSSVIQ